MNKYYEYGDDGFLVGWYEAESPRARSTELNYHDIPPARARFVNGAWVDDGSRELVQEIERLKNEIYLAYDVLERANITPAGAIRLAELVAQGNAKAIANRRFFERMYAERDLKLAQVEAGDLSVSPEPSEKWKPHSLREIQSELIQ